ncbi:MAG: adenine phosphoribosyltransferase [Verrucomicrobia bacterium]|nr:adenine phosphoribosyltransferase [Verrucomicrobiota bacterium]
MSKLLNFALISSFLYLSIFSNTSDWLQTYLESFPNFPKKGVTFRWYSKLLKDPDALDRVIEIFKEEFKNRPIDAIAALDSRGFIFGSLLAAKLRLPLVVLRKPGKLPGNVEKIEYSLEYGSASFELEPARVRSMERFLIVDDILATGGTAAAAETLIKKLGGVVEGFACLLELGALKGRNKIQTEVFSILIEP